MSLHPGQQAPDFSLTSSDKETISLSQYRGQQVVLLFFPLAFTSVCTTELCSVRDGLSEYQQSDAAVLGISVDSPFSLARFKEDNQLNFPLLSDFNKEASAAYGALYENFVLGMKGVSKRAAFVVDREGIIRYAEVLENAGELPNLEAVREALKGQTV
jgi:glutaredoxin-dependent peroxiredoxin